MSECDVAIVGAGPYGLSAAAHLKTLKGLEVRVFGQPMSFWQDNMPSGMFLRSNWTATQIASPAGALSLEAFQAESDDKVSVPVPLDKFVAYGLWFQRKAVSSLERRHVTSIEPGARGFRLNLQDGQTVDARRVVVACGINQFARRPPEFQNLPQSLASHTNEHRDLRLFAGKRVLVVGSGQSALESAALLHEQGAEVEVAARSRQIHWLQGWASKTLHHGMGKGIRTLLYAPTDVGPAGISQLLARPHLVRRLPRSLQEKLRKRATRPAGARWLVDRLRDVPITLGCSVVAASQVGDQVRISLSNGKILNVDHLLLGTGFQINIAKYDFLDASLLERIKCVNGFPILNDGMETTVHGLHILGAPGIHSFGPLLQFVSGTHFASQSLLRSLSRNGR